MIRTTDLVAQWRSDFVMGVGLYVLFAIAVQQQGDSRDEAGITDRA